MSQRLGTSGSKFKINGGTFREWVSGFIDCWTDFVLTLDRKEERDGNGKKEVGTICHVFPHNFFGSLCNTTQFPYPHRNLNHSKYISKHKTLDFRRYRWNLCAPLYTNGWTPVIRMVQKYQNSSYKCVGLSVKYMANFYSLCCSRHVPLSLFVDKTAT